MDNRNGIFYWQPGPASFGKYTLVFISEDSTVSTVSTVSTKTIVTVEITPKFQIH
jgi:hypothetical protein